MKLCYLDSEIVLLSKHRETRRNKNTNLWQPTVQLQQKIVENFLKEFCSPYLYASFGTFYAKMSGLKNRNMQEQSLGNIPAEHTKKIKPYVIPRTVYFGWICMLCFSDPPRMELRLGRSLNASNIKEGDDVYFECLIQANPPPSNIRWTRNVSINKDLNLLS